jgi:TonB family protein
MKKILLFTLGLILATTLLVNAQNNALQTDTTVFVSVEKLPEFPGGMARFYDFIIKNIIYPQKAYKNKEQGRVYVTMTVEKNGSLTNIKILRSASKELDKEAIRIIKLSPNWMPGIQNGRPVRVQYALPVTFNLEPETPYEIKATPLQIISQPETGLCTTVDIAPNFPGGIDKYSEYLKKNVPENIRAVGRVFMRLIVEEDGSFTNVECTRSIFPAEYHDDFIRLVKESPKWYPALVNGSPCRVKVYLVIMFGM